MTKQGSMPKELHMDNATMLRAAQLILSLAAIACGIAALIINRRNIKRLDRLQAEGRKNVKRWNREIESIQEQVDKL
jgi:hypothetical protein